jgi:hypothetical protein
MAAARRRRSGEFERAESLEERLDRTAREREGSSPDLFDVPAAVVCALCNDVECPGCASQPNERSRSGVVSVIAWERPGLPVLARLWATARATTHQAEGFFELLPDGPIGPALRFAAACELVASSSLFLVFLAIAGAVAPEWVKHVALDPSARATALRIVLLGLPAFSAMLVVAHAAHGLAIDRGASKNGARSARSRALRFGLYACGWDLVMGPLGGVVVAVKEGLGAAADLASALSGLPTRTTLAFLRGCYRLDGESARRALGTSYVGATIATLLFAVIVFVAIVTLVFVV